MFDETVCLTEGCTAPCTDGQRFCCRCLSENERERLHTVVIEELHASSVWENRNFSLMSFRNEDFSEKLIFASSFYGVIFENCRFDRSRFLLVFSRRLFSSTVRSKKPNQNTILSAILLSKTLRLQDRTFFSPILSELSLKIPIFPKPISTLRPSSEPD